MPTSNKRKRTRFDALCLHALKLRVQIMLQGLVQRVSLDESLRLVLSKLHCGPRFSISVPANASQEKLAQLKIQREAAVRRVELLKTACKSARGSRDR